MSMGCRGTERQAEFWVATDSLPRTPRHVFYEKLNEVLAGGGFDDFVEDLCEPFYAKNLGRPGIPPGVYFRMLFVGYFEGIDSQRGIAWRCADSRSLSAFLGYGINERTPDHSSLTRVRNRLSVAVHDEVFAFVLRLAEEYQLPSNKTVSVDSTYLEANAAMKSIVRKDTGEDWKEYVRSLAEKEGIEINSDEELRKFDKQRKNKKVSNAEWESSSDPDSRIAKMKDGRTHLAYKAEHTVVTAARNLGLLMRGLFGIGKPRCLQGGFSFAYFLQFLNNALQLAVCGSNRFEKPISSPRATLSPVTAAI